MMNVNASAYWSPATKQGESQEGLSSNAPSFSYPSPTTLNSGELSFEESQAAMSLAAAEFVPSRGTTPNPVSPTHGNENDGEYYENEEDNDVSHTLPQDADWTHGTEHTQCVTPTPAWRAAPMLQMNANLRQHLHAQTVELLRCLEPNDERYKEIPARFHSIFPLDHSSKSRSGTGSFGYPSSVFKVVEDGVCYALRRIDNARPSVRVVQAAMEQWSTFRHPNVVVLHQCFIHHRSLYFQYAYWPTAQTLADRFVGSRQPAPESLLWSYLCQLCTAIKLVHANGSALRCISAAHVLATSGNRVRISGVGIIDVVEHDQVISLGAKQKEDIVSLGTCLLTVASRCFVTNQNVSQCLAALQSYSTEFQLLVSTLIFSPPDIFSLCSSISSHLVNELSMTYAVADGLECHLSNEYNNGRMFKLLLKLDHVCDDNQEDMGDRYMLKLFRQYLFRQVNETGTQLVDIGHVVYSLNRLDIGDESQLLLASPDESTVLVVTFNDIKMCLENAFAEFATTTDSGGYDEMQVMQKMSVLELNHAPTMNMMNAPPPPPSQFQQQQQYQQHQRNINSNQAPPGHMQDQGGMSPYSTGFVPNHMNQAQSGQQGMMGNMEASYSGGPGFQGPSQGSSQGRGQNKGKGGHVRRNRRAH